MYWATTTPNVGVEFAVSKRWTLDLSAGYNPWSLPDEASLRHWLVRAEPRFWLWQPFMGHFVGGHATYARYNIGHLPFSADLEEYVYKGGVYGGGLTYGYHLVLPGRWALEFSLSAGYLQFQYDKYYCDECRETAGSFRRNYIGPTRVGISLIYMIR